MSGVHAFLPPSGGAAWVACAAWPTMNAMYPQDDTDESREGTAAHWVFEQFFALADVQPGAAAPNGVPVTEEMIEGADLYVETVLGALRHVGLPPTELHVEEQVAIPGVHAHNWGTPDTWFYARHVQRLHIFDYKFGHDFVDAFENWQCIDYASGIIDKLAEQQGMPSGLLDTYLTVAITVVQPRNYDSSGPVRTWEVKATELRAYWNKLKSAAERAFEPMPAATTGPQCKHCPGRHACTPLQRQAYSAASLTMRSLPAPLPAGVLAVELATLQDAERMLKARIAGLEAEGEARLRRGETIPGFGLEASAGRDKWTAPAEHIVNMATLHGVNVRKPTLITPAQAIKAGLPAALVQSISARTSGGMKLARIDSQKLAKTFGKFIDGIVN